MNGHILLSRHYSCTWAIVASKGGPEYLKKKRIVQTLKDGKTLKQRIIRMFRVPNCRFQCPNVFALSLPQLNTVGFAEARTACCSKRLETENNKSAIKMTQRSSLIQTFIALTLN